MKRSAPVTHPLVLVTLWVTACIGMAGPQATAAGLTAGASGTGWGPTQNVPAHDSVPSTVVLPDGTLMALWTQRASSSDTDRTVRRSVRAPGGSWTAVEVLPTEAYGFTGFAPGPNGSLHLATATWAGDRTVYEVRTWNPDGTVGEVGLSNYSSGYLLHADDAGDLVAERVAHTRNAGSPRRVLSYFDGRSWQSMPGIPDMPTELSDLLVPGAGDRVWTVGYRSPGNTLRVRHWQPGMARWKVEWSRDYPSGRSKHLYVSLGVSLLHDTCTQAPCAACRTQVT
ncbi:MAG: hypothetical protein WB471_12130 [Nocardioides sp.]